jgi:hypothetical protein
MSPEKFEAFLVKLYVDNQARSRFLADPRREVLRAGLAEADYAALVKIDRIGLELAADSFARKGVTCPPRKPISKLTRWLARR